MIKRETSPPASLAPALISAPTLIMLRVSDIVRTYGWFALGGLVAAVVAWRAYTRTVAPFENVNQEPNAISDTKRLLAPSFR